MEFEEERDSANDRAHDQQHKERPAERATDDRVIAGSEFVVFRVHCFGKPPAPPEDSRSSAISGMDRVAVSNCNPIPLTLTLSHGEREQSAAASVIREVRRADTALGCAEGQWRILPLPEGEGRGEGNGDARCAN